MLNFFKPVINKATEVVNNITNNSMWLMRWCLNHPQTTCLIIANYILIPLIEAEYKKVYVQFECGTFDVTYRDKPYNGRSCFFPEPNSKALYCYLGDTNLFDHLLAGKNEIKIGAINTGTTICEQFNKLMGR